ncbi:MAG: hypothetical protein LBR11_04135 [Deltaproteobacteria bacterium]|jgi:hypothetical protein|nr:hypothetical protein [Deltaproteobacteria bacterium]
MPRKIIITPEEYEKALKMRDEAKDDPLTMRMALAVIWFYNHPDSTTVDASEVFGVTRGVLFKDIQYFRKPAARPKSRRKRRLST